MVLLMCSSDCMSSADCPDGFRTNVLFMVVAEYKEVQFDETESGKDRSHVPAIFHSPPSLMSFEVNILSRGLQLVRRNTGMFGLRDFVCQLGPVRSCIPRSKLITSRSIACG